MNERSTKQALRDAAKQLLWERGFDAMSPRAVQDLARAGQGSFYHHYRGKAELAADALREIEAEMTGIAETTFTPGKPPLQRVRDYLLAERDGMKGCRLGRLANEAAVIALSELREPIARYFLKVQALVAQALTEAMTVEDFTLAGNLDDIAAAVVATVQGGFLLSRGQGDAQAVESAARGMCALIEQIVAARPAAF